MQNTLGFGSTSISTSWSTHLPFNTLIKVWLKTSPLITTTRLYGHKANHINAVPTPSTPFQMWPLKLSVLIETLFETMYIFTPPQKHSATLLNERNWQKCVLSMHARITHTHTYVLIYKVLWFTLLFGYNESWCLTSRLVRVYEPYMLTRHLRQCSWRCLQVGFHFQCF